MFKIVAFLEVLSNGLFHGNNIDINDSNSVRKDVLRNFAKFIGKHLCQSLLFNIVAGLRPATLLKKKLWFRLHVLVMSRRCFRVNLHSIVA